MRRPGVPTDLKMNVNNVNLPPIILASASPRRAELLGGTGLKFRIVESDAAEVHPDQLTVCEICQLNACRKARAVATRFPDSLVLGADTLVQSDNRVFGKPASRAAAESMLAALQGRTHEVVTGVCLVHLRSHRQKLFAETTKVTFRHLKSHQIRNYLRVIDPLDKAGAYAIQEQGELIVEKIVGSRSNVVGLPLERLEAELSDW